MTTTPQRRDARSTREAILRAAAESFRQGAAPVQRVARLAGVVPATVYRHFPDRHGLAVAVAAERIAALAATARESRDEPGAFRALLREALAGQAEMRALVAAIQALPAGEQRRQLDRVVAVLAEPLRRSQAAGLARPDVRPADLGLAFAMLEAGVQAAGGLAAPAGAVERVIGVLLDGFAPPAPGSGQRVGRRGRMGPDPWS